MQDANTKIFSEKMTTWRLLMLYWRSNEKNVALMFLSAVSLMTIILVVMDVLFNNWYNLFYDALQSYNMRAAYDLIAVFAGLATINIILAVYRYYLQNFLGLRWRRWLTDGIISRWLSKRSYYLLEEIGDQTDNPDQRIQEDINSFVNMTLLLLIGILGSVVTFFTFIYILWSLSGVLKIPLGHFGTIQIHGYLVWVVVIYTIIGTIITLKIGRPLTELNFQQQRKEANFRFAAIDLRVHAEHVALYRGEEQQRSSLLKMFMRVFDNWYQIILRQKKLLWFTAGFNQTSVMLPLLVVMPNYFSKVFRLGGFMQALRAFGLVQDSLAFIVNSYTTIAEWRAVVRRLTTFINHMNELGQDTTTRNHFKYHEISEDKIIAKHVNLKTPHGEIMLKDINEELIHGHHYWIRGDSGLGKSTFVRSLAGIWPYGDGEFFLPKDKNIMYIPQRSYMPLGTLQEALLFPDEVFPVSREELIQLLRDCDLPRLLDELDHTIIWSEHLSPGELQRIAFVRVLLHKPDWVFLDESTSALDLSHEKHLYDLLHERLPNCSLVSVGHRPSLEAYHDRVINLAEYTPVNA
ncbi:MAG: ABC transporter ATP-binding protein/permease [Gammaproteobacteria bacterium]|nr:ABC transporter ATP-binding protein/permease [Gammaproteobacteria bacterium]